ncbi:arabinose 5-phosphate isomerase [Podospora conica]|nr:arabinose 5-phosphate isomerase [Schizothecium conicum]
MGEPPAHTHAHAHAHAHQQQRPVHNSEVYLLNQTPFSAVPPPSPPSPITPAESEFCAASIGSLSLNEPAIDSRLALENRLSDALHVIDTETAALRALSDLYSTDRPARSGFNRAVEAIARRQDPGKLVVIGVGKSGHIARKLVATFNSLAIQAVFLHPTEALHGDLGVIHPRRDTLLLLTYSGRTPELLALLPHLARDLPLILLTAHTRPHTCDIARLRPDTILLPAPIPEPETASFGVAAPTTSTTVALTVGDALAIVASREMHGAGAGGGVASVFARNHPGGAIGQALRRPREEVRHLAVALDGIACIDDEATGADVLLAGYASPSGWVQLQRDGAGGVISPRRIRRLGAADLGRRVEEIAGLVARRADFVSIAADTTVREAAAWIGAVVARRPGGEGGGMPPLVLGEEEGGCHEDSIVAVVEKEGGCIGLLEVARLLEEA